MAANYNLGNLAAALSMTGGNPAILDEVKRQEAAQAPAPAPVAPEPEVAPVVQQPTPTPVEEVSFSEDEAAPVEGQDVEDRDFDPTVGQKSLKAEQTGAQNRALDLATEKGEIQATGADRGADELERLEGIKRGGREDQLARRDTNRAQKDDFERQALDRLNAMSEKMANPPKDTMSKVMAIIGAALTAKGNGGGAAAAQMLGGLIGDKTKQWEQSIAADQTMAKNLMEMAKWQNDDTNNELDQEKMFSSLAVGEVDAALKKIELETGSAEAKRAAEEARNTLRNQFVGHQMALNDKQAAAQAGMKRSAQEDMLYQIISRGQTPAERAALASRYGKVGQRVLQDIQKSDQNAANTDKTLAETAKTDAELAAAGDPKTKLSAEQQKWDSVVSSVGGANGAYSRLNKLVAKGGGDPSKMDMPRFGVGGISSILPEHLVPEENIQEDADINALINVVLRGESGGAIGNEEIKGKRRALGIDSNDEQVRARGLLSLMSQVRAMDVGGRLGGKGGEVSFKADPQKK
jgi:hypothetical protein